MSSNYIQMPVTALNELDARTFGFFATFVALGEEANITNVAAAQGTSAWIIRKAVSDLEDKGYLVRGYKHEGGRLRGTIWSVNLDPDRSEAASNAPDAA